MNQKAIVKLKVAMLEAQTDAELATIIIDYTHEEMMLVFNGLEWEQQDRIKSVWNQPDFRLIEKVAHPMPATQNIDYKPHYPMPKEAANKHFESPPSLHHYQQATEN
jgi:hypothetical protein